jgi:serine/threonine protein kinase
MDSLTNVGANTGIANADRFKSLKEILLWVLDLPQAERQAALDQACADDQELRSEIEGLLAHEEMAHKILKADLLIRPVFDDSPLWWPPQGSPETASPRLTGQDVSHYRIMELLGEGGWSEVYKAEDTRLGRPVALKFLRHDAVGGPETKARFIREARAIAAMEHPNICTLYAIEEWRGRLFLAMSLIEGQTLKDWIQRGPLELGEVLGIARQVTLGLEAAHAKGIIHRDIKPSNIIVSANGRAQILDFGIARRSDISEITSSGVILGTVSYMSPEQAQGGAIDNRTDLWSLGVVLFELLTGRRPFDAASDTGTLHAIVNMDPPDIHDLRPDLPSGFSGVLRRALAKSKEDRYADASEFRRDLEGLRGSSDARGGWVGARLRVGYGEVDGSRPGYVPPSS